MLASRAVANLARDVSMHAGRPLGVSLAVTPLAIGGAPELRRVSRFLDYRITPVIAELVIGWVEDVISASDRQNQESGE
jgi:hypothetical protein